MKYLMILNFVVLAAAQVDWCATPYCSPSSHVQCLYANATYGPKCANMKPALHTLTPDLQQTILDRHNFLRNRVAGGNVTGSEDELLPLAARMAKTQWDDQLAHFASLNVLQCTFQHDKCRSSEKFQWAGQNIAVQWTSYNETSLKFIINEFLIARINDWFNEYVFTRASDIKLFTRLYNGKQAIGHFTALANELQTHVGCALIHYNFRSFRAHLLVCNYAFTNMQNFPVYRSGAIASECVTGSDIVYPNLCSIDENINPNPF